MRDVVWGACVALLLAALLPGLAAPGTAPGASGADRAEPSEDRQLKVQPRPTKMKRAAADTAQKKVKAPPAARARRAAEDEAAVARALEASAAGRIDEARRLVGQIDPERLSREKADDAVYLRALLVEQGSRQQEAYGAYLKDFGKGRHRRDATIGLARLRYVEGDYAEAERLLAVFSPGVEKDLQGREGLILRGLSQLARGDAGGALQFFASCDKDLKESREEEPYYFAMSQAALRANKPQQALEALRVLLERHPQGAYAPQALYAMGVGLEMMGRGSDATNVFRQVAQRFPDSYEATRVRDRGIRPGAQAAGGLPIGGGYALQIGAFSRRDLAETLARDLRLAGVQEVTVKQGSETPPIYRVRAGAFATRDEARALGERLRRERGFSSTVVPR